jgi:hypothetical protein
VSLEWSERISNKAGAFTRSWELLWTPNRAMHFPGAKVSIPKRIKVAVVYGLQRWRSGPAVFNAGGGPKIVTSWYWDEMADAPDKSERVMAGQMQGPFNSVEEAKAHCWEVYAAAETEEELRRSAELELVKSK